MKKSRLLVAVCTAAFSFITTSSHATLFSRLGGAAAYDDVLDITWTTNAALSGLDTWGVQVSWASDIYYLGFNGWRLASLSVAAGVPTGTTTSVVDCSTATELACRDNELGYMYYHNLSGVSGSDRTGNQTVDGVGLTNIHSGNWSSTEFGSDTAWVFFFEDGDQDDLPLEFDIYGWVVRSGDVDVPTPVTIDIKPGNKRNVMNPRAKGGIWVAVLSDTNPDAPFDPSSQIDVPTVKFGPDGAKAIHYKVKDINKDGLGDLLLRFNIPHTGIACGDAEVTLTGKTFDGQSFSGSNLIRGVGC